MVRHFNRTFGLILLLVYLYALINIKKYAPDLVTVFNNLFNYPRAVEGLFIIIVLPVVGISCLIFPVAISNNFSPRFGNLHERLIPPSFVVFIGYLSITVGVCSWLLF